MLQQHHDLNGSLIVYAQNATVPDLEDGVLCEIEQKDIGMLSNRVKRASA